MFSFCAQGEVAQSKLQAFAAGDDPYTSLDPTGSWEVTNVETLKQEIHFLNKTLLREDNRLLRHGHNL